MRAQNSMLVWSRPVKISATVVIEEDRQETILVEKA